MTAWRERDFTPQMFRNLLAALQAAGYTFQTFGDYCTVPSRKAVILRHDVDSKPWNAVTMAMIESELGIRGSYHFRIVRASNVPEVIRKIADAGHEIAYHYEDLSATVRRLPGHRHVITKETAGLACSSFVSNLHYFRQYYPVTVISMHGSPSENIDNRTIWRFFNYREWGVICEPYFDMDHTCMLYLTDTGGRWDGEKYNFRDKPLDWGKEDPDTRFRDWRVRPVEGSLLNMTQEAHQLQKKYKIHFTKKIIAMAASGSLPEKMVINTHPQRWNAGLIPWISEVARQQIKNILKMIIIKTGLRSGQI